MIWHKKHKVEKPVAVHVLNCLNTMHCVMDLSQTICRLKCLLCSKNFRLLGNSMCVVLFLKKLFHKVLRKSFLRTFTDGFFQLQILKLSWDKSVAKQPIESLCEGNTSNFTFALHLQWHWRWAEMISVIATLADRVCRLMFYLQDLVCSEAVNTVCTAWVRFHSFKTVHLI